MAGAPTMVYRRPIEGGGMTLDTHLGTVEYQIVDLEPGAPPPDGWHASYDTALTEAKPEPVKGKAAKAKAAEDPNA